MGWVAIIPLLLGGAVGGALPDIDIEGSAVEKLGNKSGKLADKTIGRFGRGGHRLARLFTYIGTSFDMFVLSPIARLWRAFSKHIAGRFYRVTYNFGSFGKDGKSLGQCLGWMDDPKPWAHRGGITHSFSFLITSCIITVPISFIFQSPAFFLGCEIGILSHLVADSFCKSGTKFFFPWAPHIGFKNSSGAARGRDIRLLPPGMQVSTGKDRITNSELDNYDDREKAKQDRKLRFREKMWQKIFQFLAIASIVLLVAGIGLAPGGIGFSLDDAKGGVLTEQIGQVQDAVKEQTNTSSEQAPQNDDTSTPTTNNGVGMNPSSESSSSSSQQTTTNTLSDEVKERSEADYIRAQGSTVAGILPLNNERTNNMIAETKGPVSLTMYDIDVSTLPIGVMKMPDESLWIVGVGPITPDNLNNPRWNFTEDEKKRLLTYAMATRDKKIPNTVSQIFSSTNVADAGSSDASNTQGVTGTQENAEENKNSSGGLWGWISDITGLNLTDDSSYNGGFIGLTPWTSSSGK